MRATYDPEVDVLKIVFSDVPVEESDEERPGVILDYDKDGNIVAIEVLDASTRVTNPRSFEYAVISA
jgi:YD repeat-containing protein